MSSLFANPCTRCGTERIELKTWKEKLKTLRGISMLIHTDTACPDIECQKIVNREITARREKKEAVEKIKEERINARKQLIALGHQHKN